MSDYRTYVTKTGFGLERDAKFNNTQVDFAVLVVGDEVLDDSKSPAEQTDLVNQVREYAITIEKDEEDPNVWIARAEIPAKEGGFFIREAGIKTADGYLYSYARQAGDYKPLLEEGQGKSYTIRLKFVPGNADVIQIKIDPSVQFVTPYDLENSEKFHLESEDPHPQYKIYAAEKADVVLSSAKSDATVKSNTALTSAKEYSKNADNLKSGTVHYDRLPSDLARTGVDNQSFGDQTAFDGSQVFWGGGEHNLFNGDGYGNAGIKLGVNKNIMTVDGGAFELEAGVDGSSGMSWAINMSAGGQSIGEEVDWSSYALQGCSDGTLTWGGEDIITQSRFGGSNLSMVKQNYKSGDVVTNDTDEMMYMYLIASQVESQKSDSIKLSADGGETYYSVLNSGNADPSSYMIMIPAGWLVKFGRGMSSIYEVSA